ncbi:MAG TPA: hypothetical protein VKF82_06820 [Candidatus Eremiobacteraceae bacterium]|nr:hypothetical protein [Candidatus Eremiobacteraceae bacterium]
MNGGKDVFKRPRDFDDRALGVSLRPYEWEVLLALDGRTPLVQLLSRMGLEELEADDVADELAGKGLMDQCVVTYGEFMRERDAVVKPVTMNAAPTAAHPHAAAAMPPAEPISTAQTNGSTSPAAAPAPSGTPLISATIKPPPPRLAFSVKPAGSGSMPRLAVGITGYKLKPLLDFIIDQAGGKALPKIAAQLAVYRVFRRVPRELVLADNIHSLKIGDPTIEVHNKELYDAIVRAIEATFGVKYDSNTADKAVG